MVKTCDVCGEKLGFYKFKYAEGYICKKCYEKASKNFTQTIIQKSRKEIISLCQNAAVDKKSWEEFERTGKIGNYLLIDDKHKNFVSLIIEQMRKICRRQRFFVFRM